MSDLTGARWRKSTRSGNQGQCVEVADNLNGVVAVRDSKDADGPVLVFSPQTWRAFITSVDPLRTCELPAGKQSHPAR